MADWECDGYDDSRTVIVRFESSCVASEFSRTCALPEVLEITRAFRFHVEWCGRGPHHALGICVAPGGVAVVQG